MPLVGVFIWLIACPARLRPALKRKSPAFTRGFSLGVPI